MRMPHEEDRKQSGERPGYGRDREPQSMRTRFVRCSSRASRDAPLFYRPARQPSGNEGAGVRRSGVRGAQAPNRSAARALALAASSSRFFGTAVVSSERRSRALIPAISSMAFSNASSLALDGLLNLVILRTNCSEAACTSSSVTGGSKLKSVLIFLHIICSGYFPGDAACVCSAPPLVKRVYEMKINTRKVTAGTAAPGRWWETTV